MPKKNLTLKRLTKIMKDIAGDEKVGESSDNDVIVRKGSHLSENALFVVIVECSNLYYLLNGYWDNCDWEEHTKLTEALQEYGMFWEWYDSCCFHVYES